MSRFITYLLCILVSISSRAALVEEVELTRPEGLRISAEYAADSDDAVPVLILHGFLQTREFSTVANLAGALVDAGYAVLTPNLSLGLDKRAQSLPCEAIHNHSIDGDADEVAQWVDWLHARTGKPVTLIGHSAGGAVILNYLERSRARNTSHAILISLSYSEAGDLSWENAEHAERARKVLADGKDVLGEYALNYCRSYPTTASSYLSYYAWNRHRINDVIQQHRGIISVVIGTDDKRIKESWRQQLRTNTDNITMIEGANHFFDQAHEFDLHESVEELITSRSGG